MPQFLALIHDPVFWQLRTHSQPGSLPCLPAQIEPGLCLTPDSRLWCLLWHAATSCVPHHNLAPSPLPCPWNECICTPLVPDLAYSQPCPRPDPGATPSPTTLVPDHRVFVGISEPISGFWLMVSCHEDKRKSSSTASIPTAHGAPWCLGLPTSALGTSRGLWSGRGPPSSSPRSRRSTQTTTTEARLHQATGLRGLPTVEKRHRLTQKTSFYLVLGITKDEVPWQSLVLIFGFQTLSSLCGQSDLLHLLPLPTAISLSSSTFLSFSPQEYLNFLQEALTCTLPEFNQWNPSHTHPKVSSVSAPDLQRARKGQGYKWRQKSCSIPCLRGLQQSHEGSKILAAHH